jgi:hypothetical protein
LTFCFNGVPVYLKCHFPAGDVFAAQATTSAMLDSKQARSAATQVMLSKPWERADLPLFFTRG